MNIVLRCSILAVIIFIPFSSIQHFIEPLSDCLLADICNHTWIPECAEDENTAHRRLFIDECDIYEYNCDYDNRYLIVNYSDCFGPMTCPTLPPHRMLRQGNYLYRADGRIIYSPIIHTTPEPKPVTRRRPTPESKTPNGRRRYTPERGRKKKRKNTTPCSPCMRGRPDNQPKPKPKPKPKSKPKPSRRQLNPPRTTERPTRKLATERTTKQVIKTATIGTVILMKITVIKDGKTMYKVIKGYAPTKTTMTMADSDFLE